MRKPAHLLFEWTVGAVIARFVIGVVLGLCLDLFLLLALFGFHHYRGLSRGLDEALFTLPALVIAGVLALACGVAGIFALERVADFVQGAIDWWEDSGLRSWLH